MRAVRGPATGEEGRTISPPEAAAICPYRGLNAFREEDTPLFFGRDRLVDEPEQGLLHKVLTCPLVAVVGASGSGKSSVVRAGLLPRLRREPPSRGTWDVVAFRPGMFPFLNLAIALEAVRNPEASDAARETDAAALVNSWSSGDLPIEVSLGRAREALRVDRLLVAVDQFEELITESPEKDRLLFLSRLLAATEPGSGSTVLLTLRADYYGRAIGLDRGLCDGIQRGLVNIGAMTREERRAAIEGPARRVGLEFEPGLVERLLDDVGDEPGNLPLLEFALTEMWEEMRERREVRRLTNVAYEALGRVAGAIGRRAETVFNKLKEEQKAAAKRLFGQLVRVTDVDEEGRDTRQRVRLGDLDEASRSVVEPFVAGRLLVTARAPGSLACACVANLDDSPSLPAPDDPTTVEVAHEALIRTWERLRGWVKEDREFLLWRQRLGFQITEWERSDRDEGMLLRGALLKEAEDFKSRWDDLNNRERDFLTWTQDASLALRRQREAAELEAAAQLRLADSRRLAALSVSQRDEQRDLALLLATEALRTEPTFEARSSLLKALQTRHELTVSLRTWGDIIGVAFSPDGKVLAVWGGYIQGPSGGGMVDLWDVAARTRLVEEPLAVPEGEVCWGVAFSKRRRDWGSCDCGVPEGEVRGVAFSPDGKALAAGYGVFRGARGGAGAGGGGVVLWDVAARTRLVEEPLAVPEGGVGFIPPAIGVNDVAFSPDGKVLVAGYMGVAGNGGVVLWDVAARTRLVEEPLAVPEGGVRGVAFSPDGKVLVAGYMGVAGNGGVVLWDVAARTRLVEEPLAVPEGEVGGVAFSPDGKALAAGYTGVAGSGGVMLLWDVVARTRLVEWLLAVPEGEVRGVAFSPDGKALAAAFSPVPTWSYHGRPERGGGGVVLWDVAARAAGQGAPGRDRDGGAGSGLQPRWQGPGRGRLRILLLSPRGMALGRRSRVLAASCWGDRQPQFHLGRVAAVFPRPALHPDLPQLPRAAGSSMIRTTIVLPPRSTELVATMPKRREIWHGARASPTCYHAAIKAQC